jgi:3-oxoacyl-[acyl-carrier protein] reductase
MSLQNKVVLITGGSKGIGAAIARRVANDGALVVINYSRDGSAADALVEELGADRALAILADVSNVSEIEKLVEATVSKFGRIDVLIPNAGIMPLQPLTAITEDLYEKTFSLNYKGPLFLAQKAIPHIPDGGRIIFNSTGICSNSALPAVYGLYASSKGAVEHLTRALSKELGPKGITVNCVAPGPTQTELFMKGKPEAMIKGISAQSPFNRLADPSEIASLYAFVAGPDASWVSGQVIGVNGASFV